MRAMILAAGLGTRMRPLSNLLPKPAMPVCGVPVLAWNLALLAHHGIDEVIINTHYLPGAVVCAAEEFRPPRMQLHFSHEPELLDTGGGLRKAASFLRGSDFCLLLAGDMLLDLDLRQALARHRQSGNAASFVLLDDSRMDRFGSIGIDADGGVRRIGSRFDLGGETRKGIFPSVSIFSKEILNSLPEKEKFGFLDHWIAPLLQRGEVRIGAWILPEGEARWEPVGTPEEYLRVNFDPPRFAFFDAAAAGRERGARRVTRVVLQPGAQLGAGTQLERVVVWEGEAVPANFRAKNGVFAGGKFYSCDSSG